MLAAMKKTPRLSAAEWAELVASWSASGQSARSFAAAHGIADASLRWWKTELSRRGKGVVLGARDGGERSERRPAIARVVRAGETIPGEAGGHVAGVVILVGRARIAVEAGFDARVLRAVVEALGGAA
jgi:transposase-like protein